MKTFLLASIGLLAATSLAAAQAPVPDNLEKLSNFQSTGTTEFTFVEQSGAYADGIRETLKRIKLPAGF